MVVTAEQIMTKAKEIEQLACEFTAKNVTTQPGMVSVTSDMVAMIQQSYTGSVQALFQPLLQPDPSFFDPMIENVRRVVQQLGPESDPQAQIKSLGTKLGDDWTGHTATAFFNDYVNRHPIILGNQKSLAETLVESMEKNKAVYQHARDILFSMATKTRDAMKEIVESSFTLQDFKILVSIVALIGASAATVATFGAGAPAAGTAAAAAGSAWAGTAAKTGAVFSVIAASGTVAAESLTKEAEIKGKNPRELLTSLSKAVQLVSDEITHNTGRIVSALNESRATAHSMWRGAGSDGDGEPINLLVVKRPKIADVDLKDKAQLRSLVMPDDD